MRYFLELAYHGKAYHGWQRQPNAVSVQEVVENAIGILTQTPCELVGAGRTDAGVHAKQLFAHFDSEDELGGGMVFRLNSLLPQDIAVKGLYRVQNDVHARFDALSRSYEYHIIKKKDPFAFGATYWVKRELDIELMNKASKLLPAHTNFKSFSRSRTDVRTYNCKIEIACWEQTSEKLVFHIKADRFLRNMVRAIVGTLLEVGTGKLQVEEIHKIIERKNRSEAGASVPAHGLYLTKIEYPNKIFIV